MKKMKKIILYFLTIVLFLSVSCRKKAEEKIVGEWEMAWLEINENPEIKKIWSITAGNKIIETNTGDDGTITEEKGYYFLEKDGFDTFYINIFELFDHYSSTFNGKYKIITLNDDVLVMRQVADPHGDERVFKQIEFTKVK